MNEVVIKVIGNYSYQTSRCLGEGVYGKVFQGMERQTKEKVAIKKIDLATFTNDKYLENAIFSEIYLLKRFNHPNIVRFKDVLSSKNSLYIITEFCKNGDLKEMIKKKRFKEEEAFQIMRQILSGFTELVKEKIIHRDLKPANILINEGTYKIGDFGFAKYVDNFGSQMLKSCVGSPIYMAPQILERTQYTTKCDIWSLGVIFYEMIHGYPPWKARDEAELLRGIKGIPISHVLKRSSLSQRGNELLKKTLAYSEEERIGWTELFQNYGPKQERMAESAQSKPIQKQRHRVISANSTSNIGKWNQGSTKNTLTPTVNTNVNNNASTTTISGNNNNQNLNYNTANKAPTYSPDKKRNLFQASTPNAAQNQQQTFTPSTVHNPNSNDPDRKKTSQIQSTILWRFSLMHYHFLSVELFVNFFHVTKSMVKTQLLPKLLLCVSLLVKNRSTFCLSMISTYAKTQRNAEEIYLKMQAEHESYEMTYNDIKSLLQRLGIQKHLRNEMISAVNLSDVINEDRMQKLQQYVVSIANQNAQILSEEVRKRPKNSKQLVLVEALDRVVDILGMGMGKGRNIKSLGQSSRSEEQDFKDYVTRVIAKVDQLTINI